MLINPERSLHAVTVADGIVVGSRVVIVDCGGARAARALAVVVF